MTDPLQPAHAIRCLKAAGARSVWLVRRPSERLRTVKAWPLDAPLAIKWALGQAQPQRHVRAARHLANAGIETPLVLRGPAWVRRGSRWLLEIELEHVEGCTALELLREGDARRIAAAAEAVATMLGRLVGAKLFNRDLKLSNVIVASGPKGWTCWLLDPVGVRAMTDRRGQTARMLERLAVEAREQGLTIPPRARRRVIAAAVEALRSGT